MYVHAVMQSRYFYLMDMDQRSHHASVHKYRKKERVIHQVERFVWMYLIVRVVWVVLEKAKDGERARVTQHTSSQIMLG